MENPVEMNICTSIKIDNPTSWKGLLSDQA